MSIEGLTQIAYVMGAIVYLLILYRYFASILDMRYGPRITSVAYVFLFFANIYFMYLNNEVANIFSSLFNFMILISLYKGELRVRLISALFIYLSAFVADFVTAYGIAFVMNMQISLVKPGTSEFLYGLLGSRIIQIVVSRLLVDILGGRRLPILRTIHLVAIITTPVGSIYILYNFLLSRSLSMTDIFSSIIIVFINFIVITVYDKILSDYETDARNKQLEELIKYHAHQSVLAVESEKRLRDLDHSLTNILVGLQAAAKTNQMEYIQNRLSEILGELNSYRGLARSGNLSIDAIINYKASIANTTGVRINVDLLIPEGLILDSVVISQIMGAVLDNAIEAAEKVQKLGDRMVWVRMSYKQVTLFILVENPYIGTIIRDSRGGFLSTKRNYKSEGVGLQSIERLVGQMGGMCELEYVGDSFRVSVTLPDIDVSP